MAAGLSEEDPSLLKTGSFNPEKINDLFFDEPVSSFTPLRFNDGSDTSVLVGEDFSSMIDDDGTFAGFSPVRFTTLNRSILFWVCSTVGELIKIMGDGCSFYDSW